MVVTITTCAPRVEPPPKGYMNLNVTPVIPVGAVVGAGPSFGMLLDGWNIWPTFSTLRIASGDRRRGRRPS
jgi:hypothetical protein